MASPSASWCPHILVAGRAAGAGSCAAARDPAFDAATLSGAERASLTCGRTARLHAGDHRQHLRAGRFVAGTVLTADICNLDHASCRYGSDGAMPIVTVWKPRDSPRSWSRSSRLLRFAARKRRSCCKSLHLPMARSWILAKSWRWPSLLRQMFSLKWWGSSHRSTGSRGLWLQCRRSSRCTCLPISRVGSTSWLSMDKRFPVNRHRSSSRLTSRGPMLRFSSRSSTTTGSLNSQPSVTRSIWMSRPPFLTAAPWKWRDPRTWLTARRTGTWPPLIVWASLRRSESGGPWSLPPTQTAIKTSESRSKWACRRSTWRFRPIQSPSANRRSRRPAHPSRWRWPTWVPGR